MSELLVVTQQEYRELKLARAVVRAYLVQERTRVDMNDLADHTLQERLGVIVKAEDWHARCRDFSHAKTRLAQAVSEYCEFTGETPDDL